MKRRGQIITEELRKWQKIEREILKGRNEQKFINMMDRTVSWRLGPLQRCTILAFNSNFAALYENFKPPDKEICFTCQPDLRD